MKKKAESLWLISILLLASTVIIVALACGGDDSDDDNDDTQAGASGTTGGAAGTTSGASGTTGAAGTGTQGAAGAAETTELPTVAEGEECTMLYDIDALGMNISIFTAHGVCQTPSAPCVGGTPDMFDMSTILTPETMPAGLGDIASGLLPTPDPTANCEEGLVCCVNTDECDNVGRQITENPTIGGMVSGLSISCVTAGSCTGENNTSEMTLGCPEGQSCCVDMPAINLDAGILDTDAGTSTEADTGI